MQKAIKRVSKYKYLIFALAIIMTFGVKIMTLESEVGMRVVLTSLGIDRVGDQYEVSAQVFTPKLDESKAQDKAVVSVKADTIGDAIGQMTIKTGRIATISHCKLLVLGESVLEDDCISPINFFLRDTQLTWGAAVVATSGTAKKTLEGITGLEENASFSWQKFLDVNKQNAQNTTVDIKEFMNNNFSLSETAIINVLDIEKLKPEGGGDGGAAAAKDNGSDTLPTAGDMGGDSGAPSGTPKTEIKSGEKTVIVRKGKKVGELTSEEVNGYNWLDKEVMSNIFIVDKIDDKVFKDVKVTLKMKTKKVKFKYKEVDGKPVVEVNIRAAFTDVEVLSNQKPKQLTSGQKEEAASVLSQAVTEKIKSEVQMCLDKAQKVNADVFNFTEKYHKFKNGLLQKIGAEDFIQHVTFDFKVHSRISI